MKVKITGAIAGIAGKGKDQRSFTTGDEVELEDKLAKELIKQGNAKPVAKRGPKPKESEEE